MRPKMILALAAIGAATIMGAIAYPSMPEQIPMHWNAAGEVDNFADKNLLNAFFPVLIMAGMFLLALVLPKIDPFRKNYERFRDAYDTIIAAIIVFLAFIYGVTIVAALRPDIDMPLLASVSIGVLLVVIGNVMGRVKRNFFVGIRTPWTLANDEVWVRTNRLGARLLVAAGLGTAIGGIVMPGEYAFIALLVLVGVAVGGTLVYSYLLFRKIGRTEL